MTFGVNDYYLRDNSPTNPMYDRWGYATRQCTSFAMQRWVQDLGQRVGKWGNARDWPANARADGRHVDTAPAAHALVCFAPGVYGASEFGHVGVVDGVGSGFLNIEDYNWKYLAYYAHSIKPVSGLSFIHPASAPPPPAPPPAPTPGGVVFETFAVQARPSWPAPRGQTLHVRSSPWGTIIGNVVDGAWLHCDAYTHAQPAVHDPRANGALDARWYRIHGWGWVSSALVNGNAPGSHA